ncbi:MAG: hypothetical protein DMC60_14175, partial [Verrucomicrobia bacterium]
MCASADRTGNADEDNNPDFSACRCPNHSDSSDKKKRLVVLEKHADFNRDFRGDTIHPSTLELMHELGLLDEFLKQPHQEV